MGLHSSKLLHYMSFISWLISENESLNNLSVCLWKELASWALLPQQSPFPGPAPSGSSSPPTTVAPTHNQP